MGGEYSVWFPSTRCWNVNYQIYTNVNFFTPQLNKKPMLEQKQNVERIHRCIVGYEHCKTFQTMYYSLLKFSNFV